jgi:hypothetical protein
MQQFGFLLGGCGVRVYFNENKFHRKIDDFYLGGINFRKLL